MELIPEDTSHFFWSVLKLIDRGYYESIQTTEQHMEDMDVVEWLISRYKEKEALFQKFSTEDYTALNQKIREFGAGKTSNPYSITNNGLCLLLDTVFRFKK